MCRALIRFSWWVVCQSHLCRYHYPRSILLWDVAWRAPWQHYYRTRWVFCYSRGNYIRILGFEVAR